MYDQYANRALTLATLAFAANFSVWTLYAALALPVSDQLGLNFTELGLMLAAPMLTGALVRVPAGLIADRLPPKKLFVWQMIAVLPALGILPLATEYSHYILIGLWLGIAGASFTFGIRYITDYFPRHLQGTSMGIFGVGNAGAAITLITVPFIISKLGWQWLGPVYAFGLLTIILIFSLWAPSSASNQQLSRQQSPGLSLLKTLKHIHVWRLGLYYYFVFGSFLALLLWLPHYYMKAYGLDTAEAMAFTLFFVATSSVVRALGGWFSDRYGGRTVNWSVFWVCLVCLFFLSYPPTTMTIHGINQDVQLTISINVWVFTGLLFIIGIAQGFGRASVYKIIHDTYPEKMGEVGGVVAAIGALGGCTLPIVFGVIVDWIGIYSACFMLLYGVLAVCMIAMYLAIQAERFQARLAEANRYNFLEDDDLRL
ncbi:MAG: nitrate/nitrite transporter [Porticoccaceae bacterium]